MGSKLTLCAVIMVILAPGASARADSRLREPADRAMTSWATATAARMVNEGIFNGYPDGSFRGARATNRLEAARVLVRFVNRRRLATPHPNLAVDGFLAQFSPAVLAPGLRCTSESLVFADLPEFCFIENPRELVAEGLIDGYADSTFRPRHLLSRAELAVIVARLLRRVERRPPLDLRRAFFQDVTADEWWFGAMLVAVGAGVMQGYPDRRFRGQQPVTRNELAVVLSRLIDLPQRAARDYGTSTATTTCPRGGTQVTAAMTRDISSRR